MPPVTQSFRGRDLDNVVVKAFYGLRHTRVKTYSPEGQTPLWVRYPVPPWPLPTVPRPGDRRQGPWGHRV